jgi:hypothetical protein
VCRRSGTSLPMPLKRGFSYTGSARVLIPINGSLPRTRFPRRSRTRLRVIGSLIRASHPNRLRLPAIRAETGLTVGTLVGARDAGLPIAESLEEMEFR